MRSSFATWSLLLLLSAGCGDESSYELEGSISSVLSLDFSEIDIIQQGQTLRIEYYTPAGANKNKVCKVAVDTSSSLGRQTRGDEFKDRVRLSRSAVDQIEFPNVVFGMLSFEQLDLVPGGTVEGEISVQFEGGYNLEGTFGGPLIVLPE